MTTDPVALVPVGRDLQLVDVRQLVDRLDNGESWDEAVLNAGLDTVETRYPDLLREHLARVEALNSTGDSGTYWASAP